uniref:LIM zinc-binding domain-containing protein n=1 Tax=Ursus americanus TaxID=9643 RepID=A0A452S750_URSAM
MSNFTSRKVSPTGNDMKSTTQGITLRQQGFHEVNKRRTFLQDNSWIKKRPEEEKDENYGRVVLNRHNSHDALDRKVNERDEPKATISRYRSDDTLDRISDRNDATKTYKANTLDNRLTNRYQRPGDSFSASAASTPAPSSATTPVKRKRQSWFPPPPPGYSATPSTGAGRREPTVHPPIPPKPSSSVSSPNQLRRENRQICPPKPGVYTETNRSAERNIRSQDLENIVKVATSLQKTNKGNQGLDGLFRTNPKAEQTEKRAKSLENLIFMNTQTDKDVNGLYCSFNAETRHAGPKDTFVYTRTYVENRSVIERDMCTYCRKPLGTETKMILDELQICCHSTCFKCEICKQPLENLQAGDSIWIYRQTIHCEPCYSKVMAKWIQ